jgi:uncharacterized protein involved in exopolysaccharide biosynthesis
MVESFDSIRYIRYLQSRWRYIVASAAIAVAAAAAISFVMPPRYTATARIVIEPPAGADSRTAVAVSPIYLESLKTYEQFASGDSLFQKAAQRFGLSGVPIESLKRRVLTVGIVRNTRILEISANLPDPKKAQALARFLAEQTVELNRSSAAENDQELLSGLEQQERDIHTTLQQTERTWSESIANEPTSGLEAAIQEGASQRSTLEDQIQSQEVEIAGLEDRMKAGDAGGEMAKEVSNAHARLVEMRRHMAELSGQMAEREKLLGTRQAHRDQLEADRRSAQTALASIEGRLRDARSERGFRGERLQVIDPGIVPERPSSPNIPLNIAVALLAGLALPILYFTLRAGFHDRREVWEPTGYRTPVRSRND